MIKLQNLGKTLSKDQQKRIMGGDEEDFCDFACQAGKLACAGCSIGELCCPTYTMTCQAGTTCKTYQ